MAKSSTEKTTLSNQARVRNQVRLGLKYENPSVVGGGGAPEKAASCVDPR